MIVCAGNTCRAWQVTGEIPLYNPLSEMTEVRNSRLSSGCESPEVILHAPPE